MESFNQALLEIGVEELPPHAVERALDEIKEKGEEILTTLRIDYEKIITWGSSRRLILLIEGLASQQKDRIEKIMGPPRKMVLDEKGKITEAGKKFLKAKGIKKEEIGIERTEKGEYIYIKRKRGGKETKTLLPHIFYQLIYSLNFPKSMRWEEGNFYFGRPIRYILALFGEELLPFKLAGVTSGKKTKGHRYLSPSTFAVESVHKYPSLLKKKRVIIDPEERRKIILSQKEKIISSLKRKWPRVKVLEDKELLEEMVYLVEYPTLFLGKFNPRFLHLPSPILRACLRDYQKYFSMVNNNEILPYFIGVREGTEEYIEEVIKGNERVLNARLTDAKYFFEEDKKISLKERVPLLKGMMVQKRLGNYYDKTMRLVKLVEKLSCFFNKEEVKERVKRAAYLCKADLLTQVVKEFPSLEGIMGKEYALIFGEDERVAQAIFEHRMPRFHGDRLPESIEGSILALADKLDTLVGSFWAGLIPSGSEDPWGIRREAHGIIEILLQREWRVSLSRLIEEALNLYGKKEEKEEIISGVRELFKMRMRGILKNKGIKADEIKALMKVSFDDPVDLIKRGESLHKVLSQEKAKEEVIAIVRVLNILKQADEWQIKIPEEIKENLLKDKEERELYHLLKEIKKEVEESLGEQKYIEAYRKLSILKESIHSFFDKVLVMSENKELRINRLSLMKKIGDLFLSIADFTELQIKKSGSQTKS